jgi:transcriptional regulator with XRE-family HTH domain
MRPIEHIRRHVFDLSQAAFGEIAGTTQASVSRWESGNQDPDLEQMARIREAARSRGLPWNDGLFFKTPESVADLPERARTAS